MNKGFRHIFWGLLFLLIDIRIELFDIIPDFIGYIFIVNGLSTLSLSEERFAKVRPFAIALIFLSIPSLLGVWEVDLMENHISIFAMLFQLITGIIQLLMMYFIFDATFHLATKYDDETWAEATKSRWKIYMVIHILILTMNGFMFNVAFEVLQVIFIVLVIAALIVDIVIIVFMKGTERRSEKWDGNIEGE